MQEYRLNVTGCISVEASLTSSEDARAVLADQVRVRFRAARSFATPLAKRELRARAGFVRRVHAKRENRARARVGAGRSWQSWP